MKPIAHKERAHSKYSASGSERWLTCAASVELEENSPPSKDSYWSKEGTLAHECLEAELTGKPYPEDFDVTAEMVRYVKKSAAGIRAIHKTAGGPMLVEKRVHALYIHEEMFGTCDVIIPGYVTQTLHIVDFKYGAGHVVQPDSNTQLIQYALSAIETYDWDRFFEHVKLWIFQPRVGDTGYKSWGVSVDELKNYWLPLWVKGVARVERGGNKPFPGKHCHWCRAKLTCPAKNETRMNQIVNAFSQPLPSEATHGFQKENDQEESEVRGIQRPQKSGQQKAQGRKARSKKESRNAFVGFSHDTDPGDEENY